MPAQLAQAELLCDMGWVEWDLRSGRGRWSDHVYVIFDRSPAEGPVDLHELAGHVEAHDLPGLDRLLWSVLTSHLPVHGELRIRRGAGPRDVQLILEAVFGPGGATAVRGVVQDITERRSAERVVSEVRAKAAEEGHVLLALRNAILPAPGPSVDLADVRIAVRYVPAETTAKLGGDWYEATTLHDGRLLLAVGDVSGHGLSAIAQMAQLRHGLVGLTMTGQPADQLLVWLNDLLLAPSGAPFDEATATVVAGHLDPESRVFEWAQAGHPAPILVRDGVARQLDAPPGVMLGAARGGRPGLSREELRGGDVLLLFTDGLVERRGRDIGAGLASALAAAGATLSGEAGGDLDGALDRLLAAAGGSNPEDDMCLLAVGVLGE
ncbi:PP2C family protein-serine/threonine phosphatase [Sinosporangium siamense]|uniref:PP2C family protein-serine/threonine phosphatase n=1 Tax=Sinosporangium siamense TaxID=1367973 RepID=UPI001EF1A57E|nr:SpoIIE family protein phosphatase [Sinosporangium siamense]